MYQKHLLSGGVFGNRQRSVAKCNQISYPIAMERITLYVDVRRPDEFVTGHIPGALNISMEEEEKFIEAMRQLVGEHDVTIYCQSGFRASYAQSFLETKHGIVVENLDGGISLYQGPLEFEASAV